MSNGLLLMIDDERFRKNVYAGVQPLGEALDTCGDGRRQRSVQRTRVRDLKNEVRVR